MENSEIIVGLDIGTTKICAMVGRRNEFGKIEILGMGKAESVGVMRGMVANIDKTVQSIKEAIAEASNSERARATSLTTIRAVRPSIFIDVIQVCFLSNSVQR